MTVEFAIAVPVLLIVAMAAAELGRAFYQYNTLVKAVRDGARYLAGNVTNGAGLVDAALIAAREPTAKNLVVYGNPGGAADPLLPGFSPGNVTVLQPDPIHVAVTATYSYTPLLAIPTLGFGSGIATASWDMNAAVIMRGI